MSFLYLIAFQLGYIVPYVLLHVWVKHSEYRVSVVYIVSVEFSCCHRNKINTGMFKLWFQIMSKGVLMSVVINTPIVFKLRKIFYGSGLNKKS